MMLINLLPHREEARRRRKQSFGAFMALAAGAGVLLSGAGYVHLLDQASTQETRNAFLTQEIAKLDDQIKDVNTLKSEIEALKARQKVVEDFQTDRNMPVHWLNELVNQTPDGIQLKKVSLNGQVVTVAGLAQSNERVSELLRNAAYNATWIAKPELVEIKAVANTNTTVKDQRRLFDFEVKMEMKRPGEGAAVVAAAGSASAPGAAPIGSVPGAAVPSRVSNPMAPAPIGAKPALAPMNPHAVPGVNPGASPGARPSATAPMSNAPMSPAAKPMPGGQPQH